MQPHDKALALADRATDAMQAANDDSEAVGALQQALLELIQLTQGQDADAQYMACAGFASGLYIPLLDGLRHQAATVIQAVQQGSKKS